MAEKKISELTAATAVADDDDLVIVQGGTTKQVPAGAFTLPLNYLAGLITSNGTDTEHDIDISAGVARSVDNVANMTLAAVLTKQLDVAWAVGDDDGGLDTGSPANNTIYAVWLIKRSDTGVVDALFSESFTAPTMPADYDLKRLIGAFKTEGSANILGYIQYGDYFEYNTPLGDVATVLTTGVPVADVQLSVPPSARAHILGGWLNVTFTTGSQAISFRPNDAPSVGVPSAWIELDHDSADFDEVRTRGYLLTDSSGMIKMQASFTTGAMTAVIETHGFHMLTRRDP